MTPEKVGDFLKQWQEELLRQGLTARESEEELAFLTCLPKETPVYAYKGHAQTETATHTVVDGGYCIMVNVPQTFIDHVRGLDRAGIGRIKFYSARLKTLVVKMPTRPHEAIPFWFTQALAVHLREMGMRMMEWLTLTGAATFDLDGEKEPDGSFCPRQTPRGRSDLWPSLVVEVGKTESHAALENEAKIWMEKSDGQTKVVLTFEVSKTLITVNRYGVLEEVPYSAVHQQKITLQMPKCGQDININGGPLVIPFQDLFLIPPAGDQGDIVFGDIDLEELAKAIRGIFDKEAH